MPKLDIRKNEETDFRTVEAYKSLRTNIQFCGTDVKVIALTSCAPNEGKSMVAFNLASSMAESGKKTLFIDSDLRKSVLIGRYQINKSVKGLTEYLSGVEQLDSIVYETNIENMDVILSGPVPPNPVELIDSDNFDALIQWGKDNYDIVIIDTPPVGQVIDPAIVARKADGVIFLIAQGSISYRYAQKQIAQLKKSGCRILGAVLNKVDFLGKGKKYEAYYKKYYKSYYSD